MPKAKRVAENYLEGRDGDETPPEEPPIIFPDPHEEEAEFDRDDRPGQDTPPAEDGAGGTPNQQMEVDQEGPVPDNASITLSSNASTNTIGRHKDGRTSCCRRRSILNLVQKT